MLNETDSGDFDGEHETRGVSKVKLLCSFLESLLLDSRVGVSRMSIAHEFSFSRDTSRGNNVESRSLSRTMVLWPEGHGLSSSKVGDGCSVSLESLGEMNFASSNGLLLG